MRVLEFPSLNISHKFKRELSLESSADLFVYTVPQTLKSSSVIVRTSDEMQFGKRKKSSGRE